VSYVVQMDYVADMRAFAVFFKVTEFVGFSGGFVLADASGIA
jgi:hypothetical protein